MKLCTQKHGGGGVGEAMINKLPENFQKKPTAQHTNSPNASSFSFIFLN
jgi:hypothetical protein